MNITIQKREEKFAEKASNGYGICLSQMCPKREHCLHWLLRTYTPKDQYYAQTVNLNNPQTQTPDCPLFRSDRPLRMPLGLSNIYYDMPERIAKPLKQHLISYLNRKRYYEYNRGSRPICPEHEQYILEAVKRYGWDKPVTFNSYVEEYLW